MRLARRRLAARARRARARSSGRRRPARRPAAARRRGLPRPRLATPPTRDRRGRATTRFSPSRRRSCAPGCASARGRATRSPRCRPRAGRGSAPAYADEHRPLIMLALGRPERRRRLVRAANSAGPARRGSAIARPRPCSRSRGDRAGALALLEGDAGRSWPRAGADRRRTGRSRRDRRAAEPAWPSCWSALALDLSRRR